MREGGERTKEERGREERVGATRREQGRTVVDRVARQAAVSTAAVERNVLADALGASPTRSRDELALAELEEEAERAPDEDERARVERERVLLALTLEEAGRCGRSRAGRARRVGRCRVGDARRLRREDVGGEARAERVGDDADFAAALLEFGVAADEEVGLLLRA